MRTFHPRHRPGGGIACCSTSSLQGEAPLPDFGSLASQHLTSTRSRFRPMGGFVPSLPSNRHICSWQVPTFTDSAYFPRRQMRRFQGPNTSGTPTASRWAPATSSGVFRPSLSAPHKAARQALRAASPECSNGRNKDAPTPAMQQTVMSPTLWFCMDHFPGSCLLLISFR